MIALSSPNSRSGYLSLAVLTAEVFALVLSGVLFHGAIITGPDAKIIDKKRNKC